MLNRLFDTLSRAEILLERHEDDDRSKQIARVASEYTQLLYLIKKAKNEGCSVVDSLAAVCPSITGAYLQRVDLIKANVGSDLSVLLISALRDASQSRLRQCLRTYELIEGWADAEEVIRKEFGGPCRQVCPSEGFMLTEGYIG